MTHESEQRSKCYFKKYSNMKSVLDVATFNKNIEKLRSPEKLYYGTIDLIYSHKKIRWSTALQT